MSIAVDLDALRAQIDRFGARALLVTTSIAGPPHVSSVLVTVEGGDLAMGVGRTTRVNTATNPAVSLVWVSPNDDEYCLIVDGTAGDGAGEPFVVTPTSAVLHRLAGAASGIPRCVPVDER